MSSNMSSAEFRGPGVRHQFDQDSPDEYGDLDMDSRTKGFGGRSGRIILLGDGTEVLTDSDDVDMFDQTEEDKDAENQIQKGISNSDSDEDVGRSAREGTPGPQSASEKETLTESPSSTHTEASQGPGTTIKGVSDGAAKN